MGIWRKIASLFCKKAQPSKDASPAKGGASLSKERASSAKNTPSRKGEQGKSGSKRSDEWSPGDFVGTPSRSGELRSGERRRSRRPQSDSRGKEQHRGEGKPISKRDASLRHSGGKRSKGEGRRFSETVEFSKDSSVDVLPKKPIVSSEPWDSSSFQVTPEEGKKRFHDFQLPEEILHAIADLNFRYCTPIQAASLEQSLAGANIAGRAQTGTGKTAAYLVSILTRYLRTPDKRQNQAATPRALVIAPTRELCVQICADALALGKYCDLHSMAVFGGMDYARQQRELTSGPIDLLAATPGRLLDFVRQHIVDLSKIDTLVIDEADRMLDMGFIPDVRRIIRALPAERQTLLYSATLNDDVMRLASQWMPNPVKVEIEPDQTANSNIDQKVLIVTSAQKFTVLCNLLKAHEGERVLVFGNRRSSTDMLAERLRRKGFPCELLSGEVSQGARMKVLENFKSGKTKLVVATDVAGRGLHIADIGLVINFELPYEAEDYVHRIGRTGRAGKVGTAVSFADEDESFAIPDIEEYLGEELKTTMLAEDDPLLRVDI